MLFLWRSENSRIKFKVKVKIQEVKTSRCQEVKKSRGQEVKKVKKVKNVKKVKKVKKSWGQEVKRSRGQEVKRSRGQDVKRSRGQKVMRSKGRERSKLTWPGGISSYWSALTANWFSSGTIQPSVFPWGKSLRICQNLFTEFNLTFTPD